MEISGWLTVVAILLAPLLALQVSTWLERWRERRSRRVSIFKTLMATRASTLELDHVRALNMIDVEFHGRKKKEKAVLNAWKAYLDHLNQEQTNAELWATRRQDLFVELLYEMAVALNYDFDKTSIRRTSYFPVGYGRIEEEQLAIRTGLAEVLSGRSHIPIAFASDGELDEETRDKWISLVERFLSHARPVRVLVENTPETEPASSNTSQPFEHSGDSASAEATIPDPDGMGAT